MTWIKGLVAVAVALVLLAAVVAGVGMSLPEEHVVTRSAVLAPPPAEVWAVIRDFEYAPEWQPDVESTERVAGASSETWILRGTFGDVPIRVEDEVPPDELVTRIVGEDLPFGGSWIYQLEPAGEGTRLTITETGYVTNPFLRFASRFVFGHASTVENYLEALVSRLGGAAAA